MKKVKETENEIISGKYLKDQIIKSKKFSEYNRDVLTAILKDDCLYDVEEVKDKIKAFLERVV